MYLIAGLGNPGREYEATRHNAGFRVVDRLAEKIGCEVGTRKFLGFTGSGMLGGEKVLLLKPQTYMNNSGESVRAAADFYKLAPEQVADPHIGSIEGFGYQERKGTHVTPCEFRKDNFNLVDYGIQEGDICAEAGRCLQCDLRLQISAPRLWGDYSDKKEANA